MPKETPKPVPVEEGTAIRKKRILDKETGEILDVNLTLRDIIYFDLLEKLNLALKRNG